MVARLRIGDEVAYLHTADLSFDRDATHRLLAALIGDIAGARGHRTRGDTRRGLARYNGVVWRVAMRESSDPAGAANAFDPGDLQFRAFVHDEI